MQDVVAVVGGQNRVFLTHAHDVAERMFLPLQHAHGFAVAIDLLAAVGRHRHQRRIRRIAQQPLIKLELAHQIQLGERLARRRQYRHGHQIDRRHRGGGVDLRVDALCARSAIGIADPVRRAHLHGRKSRARHSGLCFCSNSSRAIGCPRFTCTVPNLLRNTATMVFSRTNRLSFSLGLARQLADIGPALDDALIAEVHRHEYHRPPRIAQVAAHRHRQHARCAARAGDRSGCGRPR